jgi:hypothetical protein
LHRARRAARALPPDRPPGLPSAAVEQELEFDGGIVGLLVDQVIKAGRAGAVLTWKAAPRLDLIADAGGRKIDDDYGLELVGRARLRLDDRGVSLLGAELRRSGVADDEWTGVRGMARIALGKRFTASTELELVIPDVDRSRGRVWPWALGAVSWDCGGWQAAIAAEVSASPEHTGRFDLLGQLARRWGGK